MSETKCASTTLTLPRQARVFVAVEADWNTLSAPPVQAICDLRIDGTTQPGTAIRAAETTQNTNPTGHYKHTGLTHVTGVLPAGNHEFAFYCQEEDSDNEFRNVMVSAIMLGEG